MQASAMSLISGRGTGYFALFGPVRRIRCLLERLASSQDAVSPGGPLLSKAALTACRKGEVELFKAIALVVHLSDRYYPREGQMFK